MEVQQRNLPLYLVGDKEAQHFLDNVYYKNFPRLKSYFANQGKFAQDNGYSSNVTTI